MFACENCDWKGTDPDGFRQSFNDWAGYQDEHSIVIVPAGSCPECEAPVYEPAAHAAFTLAKAAPAMLAALKAIQRLPTAAVDCARGGVDLGAVIAQAEGGTIAPAPVFVLSVDGGVLQSIETDSPAGTPRPRLVLVDYDIDGLGEDERVKLVGEQKHPGSRYAIVEDVSVNDDAEYVARVLKAADQKSEAAAKPPKKRPMHCACCGGYAGEWVQFFNQDTGHGLCAKCRDWLLAPREGKNPRMTPDDMRRTYGEPGVHYEAPDQSRSLSGSPSSTKPK